MKWPLLVALAGAGMASASFQLSTPALFRKPDRNGASCFTCHSPDGLEIRAFGFDAKDIARRASQHLTGVEARRLAVALRQAPLKGPELSPDGPRPLQPGGVQLAGASPADRDLAFARQLNRVAPELVGPRIASTEAALAARDRLMALDPRTVPVGIPFNRLSEDGFHGREHATVADWIPDVAITFPKGYEALADAYLADPSEEHLRALDQAIAHIVPMSQINQLALAKYRSLLLLQHAIRTGGTADARLDRIHLIGKGNPFWDVAEMAHHASEGDPKMLGASPDLLKKKRDVPLIEQMRQLRLPWYWIGWTLDPSLRALKRGFNRSGERADYFTQFLWEDGPYPAHLLFMLSKKLVAQAYGADLPKGQVRHYEIQYGYLLLREPLLEPKGDWAKEAGAVDELADNAFRLSLFLLLDDLQKTGGCVRPESQRSQIGAMKRFFIRVARDPDAVKLCDRVEATLASARVDER